VADLREQISMSESTALPALQEPDRKCARCETIKPADAYNRKGFTQKGTPQRRNLCAACLSETRTSRQGQPRGGDQTPEKRRASDLKRIYGISVEQYAQMLAVQEGKCAICRRPPKGGRPLAVDHCHQSGRVRALLCAACNRFVGGFEFFRERGETYLDQYGAGNPLLGYDD
jgi:hypothetical protein